MSKKNGSGFKVQGSGFWVLGLGFWVLGLSFQVSGIRFQFFILLLLTCYFSPLSFSPKPLFIINY